MRKSISIAISDNDFFLNALLAYSRKVEHFALLHSHPAIFKAHNHRFLQYDVLIAVGAIEIVSVDTPNALSAMEEHLQKHQDWHFGYIGYDVKNEIEDLVSGGNDGSEFPDLFFFIPRFVVEAESNKVIIYFHEGVDNPATVHQWFQSVVDFSIRWGQIPQSRVCPTISRDSYLLKVEELKQHLYRGDIYEVNFCQEFFNDNIEIAPENVFYHLLQRHPAPFSAFLKAGDKYILSTSPERYLRKEGSKVVSQPMKGTARRRKEYAADQYERDFLQKNPKERAENTMIVDLVRNDLSRFCIKGTVCVEELCGVYPFPTVHQMISTVSGMVEERTSVIEILRNTFPMGSMTGAPKIRAMKLIEHFETSKRGVYSGALGYIKPNSDFDFSVVIRTLLYNAEKKYLSCSVGSAITALCDGEKEYKECLLKLKGLVQLHEEFKGNFSG